MDSYSYSPTHLWLLIPWPEAQGWCLIPVEPKGLTLEVTSWI